MATQRSRSVGRQNGLGASSPRKSKQSETTMKDLQERFAKELEAKLFEDLMGGPAKKPHQTALRLSGRSFETVELDDNGNVIEPPQRCCNGVVLHEPGCKYICS